MAFRAIRVALLLSALVIAGCGTGVNLVRPGPAGGKVPFGGVSQDLDGFHKAADGNSCFGKHPKAGQEQQPQVAPLLFFAADLPFSFLGDVVTWPYTASYTFINQPIPVPPLILAPDSLPPQGTTNVQPQTYPAETLPTPRKLPDTQQPSGKEAPPEVLPAPSRK
jgi:uncharacterized protein YceK